MPPDATIDPARLPALADVAGAAPDETVERALEVARELLGMDIGYVARLDEEAGLQRYEAVNGDADGFGMHAGGAHALEGSYCRRMTLGAIDHLVPDVAADPELRDLELTRVAKIGAYVGVPITFSDGSLYGTICCASHDAAEQLGERDVAFMQVLARVVGAQVEQDRLRRENEDLRAQVQELRVEIDTARRDRAVAEIEDTDWFADLRERAAALRAR